MIVPSVLKNPEQQTISDAAPFSELWTENGDAVLKSGDWTLVNRFPSLSPLPEDPHLPFSQNIVQLKVPGKKVRVVSGSNGFIVLDDDGREDTESFDLLLNLWEDTLVSIFSSGRYDVVFGHLMSGDDALTDYFATKSIEESVYAFCLVALGRTHQLDQTEYTYPNQITSQMYRVDIVPSFGVFQRSERQHIENGIIEIPANFDGFVIRSAMNESDAAYKLERS